MNFDCLIDLLQRKLREPLPGKPAHLKMAPQPVDMRRFEPVFPENHRKCGVLVLFFPDGKDSILPLIKRPEYAGFHSGQVSFPGGKMEPEDENITQTSLREAQEEMGIDRREVHVLGKLSDLYIPTSNFLVSPIVGYMEKRPNLIPEEKEVSRIIQMDLGFLFRPEVRKQKDLEFGPNMKLNTPYFEIEGEVVWGATAMILSELVEILKSDKN